MRVFRLLISLSVLVLALALAVGCGSDGSSGGEDVSEPADAAGAGEDAVTTPSDVASSDDGGAAPDGDSPGVAEREVLAVTTHRVCYGCRSVSVCNWPAISDMTAVELGAAPNNQTGVLFALERFEAAGRALPLETCKVFTGAELDAVTTPPSGAEIVDGGTISLSGEMDLLSPPQEITYSSAARTYESTIRFASDDAPYEAGTAISLESAGGEQVRPFLESGVAPETFELLTPAVDAEGKIANIATDQPLEVTWTGGGDFDDVVLILNGFYCNPGPDTFVACHVENDGAFTIGTDVLGQITWPNAVEFMLSMSHKFPMAPPELTDGAAWSNRSYGWLYIWWDPAAAPPPITCESDHMDEGFVGAACSSDDECGGGCCLQEVEGHFENNYCTLLDCAADDDCPADAVCVAQNNPFIGIPDYCGKVCASDDDCRDVPAYACLEVGDGTKVCRPNLW